MIEKINSEDAILGNSKVKERHPGRWAREGCWERARRKVGRELEEAGSPGRGLRRGGMVSGLGPSGMSGR